MFFKCLGNLSIRIANLKDILSLLNQETVYYRTKPRKSNHSKNREKT